MANKWTWVIGHTSEWLAAEKTNLMFAVSTMSENPVSSACSEADLTDVWLRLLVH